MMIRSIPEVLKRVPNLLYSVVGEGWERRYLQGLVAELGVENAVQFRGVPEDRELVYCYQQCDLFVLANRQVGWDFEGFGIVLLEAQACGKPVVTGRSGGTTEAVSVHRSGLSIDCSDFTRLPGAITALITDGSRLSVMSNHARQWAEHNFEWRVTASVSRGALAIKNQFLYPC